MVRTIVRIFSLRIVILAYILFPAGLNYLLAQNFDKNNKLCGSQKLLEKAILRNLSGTENQKKIDINYYDISIDIDLQNSEIFGSVLVEGSVDMDQPAFIELDLSSNLTVDSVKLGDELINFLHNDNLIKIPAPIAVPEGYQFNVTVFYHGTPLATGFGSFNFDEHEGIPHVWTLSEPYGARDWWPCKDDPSDKADSLDIEIILPSPQIAVSNGKLKEQIDMPGGKIKYHWSERYPISTYLVSITTYPYIKWVDEYIGLNGDPLPLEYYVYPDNYNLVYENYSKTKEMIEVFANKFGEYPFMGEKYGHVEFGRGGGMEHQTISSMGGYSEWLIAHELGHQWWGNLVTCESFHHIWLNEGFARFSEAIWEEHVGGQDAYINYWNNHTYYGSGTIYVEDPSTTSQIFNGNLSYNKAGWVLHMLRGVMGDDAFFSTLKSYGSNDSLAYASASTEDFKLVCETQSGLNLESFFQQWIYGEYYPKYALSWEISENQELIVRIQQTQPWQYFEMPIDIKIISAGQTTMITVHNNEPLQDYNLGYVDFIPDNILLDPNNWILKEVEYLSLDNMNPSQFKISMYPAYPNPFNSKTTVEYFISDNNEAREPIMKIYDINGNLVDRISISGNSIGGNALIWDATGKASGTYIFNLLTTHTSQIQKVQLVK